MARKPSIKKVSPTPDADPMVSILSAAMEEAAAVGWAHLSFEAVATRAGMKLGDVLAHVPTQAHLLARVADHVDRTALLGVSGVDHTQSVKDRLFDLLMRRFDVLQRHRAGILALMAGVARDPGEGLMLLGRLSRSMAVTLTAAGVSPHGLKGMAHVTGLKAVYLAGLRTWQKDESSDMAKTMAALDKALGYAERAANFSLSNLKMRRDKADNAGASH